MSVMTLSQQSVFLSEMTDQQQVSSDAADVLHASGARTPEGVLSLLQNFPSTAKLAAISSPHVSNYVIQRGGVALQAILGNALGGKTPMHLRRAKPRLGYGALAPPMARWQRDKQVPWPPEPPPPPLSAPPPGAPAPPGGGGLIHSGPVDTRRCLPWAVRDQGRRGTCVAFGTTALREQLACDQGTLQDFSEQFLYWDIKTNSLDPNKSQDGTWIEFALQRLAQAGICPESSWGYNGVFDETNISQGTPGIPSPAVITSALAAKYQAAVYRRTSVSTGSAQTILNLLMNNNRPLAISVPVFSDPNVPQSDNWATNVGWSYGFVLDPPPASVVSGGHCVCVTGFIPDATEPLGGYFVIRNSWSTDWGTLLPAGGYFGPEAGYGQISASYVDQFLWEFGQL